MRKTCVKPRALTDGDQPDVLPLQELQRHRDVLQLHLPEVGSGVVLPVHLLLAQHLQQPDQLQPVAQVLLQVVDPLVDALEVLVAPPGEGVLLDLLPRSVLGQVLLGGRHLLLLLADVGGALVELRRQLRLQVAAVAHHGAAFIAKSGKRRKGSGKKRSEEEAEGEERRGQSRACGEGTTSPKSA